MTVNDLRKKYPSHDFVFFKNGFVITPKSYYIHYEVKGYSVFSSAIFIDL